MTSIACIHGDGGAYATAVVGMVSWCIAVGVAGRAIGVVGVQVGAHCTSTRETEGVNWRHAASRDALAWAPWKALVRGVEAYKFARRLPCIVGLNP